MKNYDLIVIGSGPAGEKAAAKAAYFGKRVALIEKEEKFGGAGIQTGTLPSKTLKETALFFSGKNDKGIYGLDRLLRRDMHVTDFMYRKNRVVEKGGYEVETNMRNHEVDIYNGLGRFEDAHHVRVVGSLEETLYGENIIISTGSYPFRPADIPFDGRRIHDSDSILDLERLPKSLCVLGAGVIGCEYATIFAALGIKVFLVNKHPSILPFLDHELADALLERMERDGIKPLMNTVIKTMDTPDTESDLIRIELETGEILNVDMFLFAAGRRGQTENLGLETVNLDLTDRGAIKVNEKYQTSVPNIYAVGDVIGFPALASTSMDQGRVAVSHIFEVNDLNHLPSVLPFGIYTIPEVSTVGLTEQDAQKKGLDYGVGHAYFKDTARGRIKGIRTNDFLKIVFDIESEVILGVHIIGDLATEILHYGMSLVEDQHTLKHVIATVFNYPTLHSLYKYACYDALGNKAGHKVKNPKKVEEEDDNQFAVSE